MLIVSSIRTASTDGSMRLWLSVSDRAVQQDHDERQQHDAHDPQPDPRRAGWPSGNRRRRPRPARNDPSSQFNTASAPPAQARRVEGDAVLPLAAQEAGVEPEQAFKDVGEDERSCLPSVCSSPLYSGERLMRGGFARTLTRNSAPHPAFSPVVRAKVHVACRLAARRPS